MPDAAPGASAPGAAVFASRRIGFRVFAIVTGNDTDPSSLSGVDGSGNITMRFKINGADLWARGANMVMMEELEGRASTAALVQIVQSAADASMNVFRVWGGGVWQYDSFYDACDELGVLLYHDAMYAQGGHFPNANTGHQPEELAYQVRRLSHHPSIALWDACNECGGGGNYATFVMATIAGEDASRPPWPSCPSNGWIAGVDRLTSLPNGKPLVPKPSAWAPAPARAPARGLAALTAPPDSNCTFIQSLDFAGYISSTGVSDANSCCEACATNPACWAATLSFLGDQLICWLKNETQAGQPVFNTGTEGCWVNARGPSPVPADPMGKCNPLLAQETHGGYQQGDGWATVNSRGGDELFSPNVPPLLDPPYTSGVQCPGTFASEFGGSSMSSFESMAPTLSPAHWGLESPPMFQRNYAANNFVRSYFGDAVSFNATGALAFRTQLYFATLGAALEIAADVQVRRTRNSFGTVLWQMGEVWPTGGWGLVEYGTVGFTPGQVLGGRWKPAMYLLARSLFTDVFGTCGVDGRCFFKNDGALSAFAGEANIELLGVATGQRAALATVPLALPRGAGAGLWVCADGSALVHSAVPCPTWAALLASRGCAASGADCVLLVTLTSPALASPYVNTVLLATPQAMLPLPAAWVSASVAAAADPGGRTISVTVSSDETALFVVLTTLAQGRFSDNAIVVPKGGRIELVFIAVGAAGIDRDLLVDTLRVEHVALYATT